MARLHTTTKRPRQCDDLTDRPKKKPNRSLEPSQEPFALTHHNLAELNRATLVTSPPLEPPSSPRPVSLQRYARSGGADLSSDLGLSHRLMVLSAGQSSRPSKWDASVTSSSARRSSTSGAGDPESQKHLVEGGIFPPGYKYSSNRVNLTPANMSEIRERLLKPRPSLSPSVFGDSCFEDFQNKDSRVVSEASVMSSVLPLMHGGKDFESAENLLFTNLKPYALNAPRAKPDLYDGCVSGDLAKPIRDSLDQSIVPTKHSTAPIVPNFFIQAKGPLGMPHEARLQISNDLATGARAIHALQNYDQQPRYDGNAYALGVTYQSGTSAMHIYSGHPVPSVADTEIHINQVRAMILTDSPDACRQGISLFRNARDLSEEWRDNFIQEANSKVSDPDMKLATHAQDTLDDGPFDDQEQVSDHMDASGDMEGRESSGRTQDKRKKPASKSVRKRRRH
ncbi:hypothetical protein VM1G_11213 [Cytospora mali]|uniref:Uncharacterized protein n=1 Tax=Cytospora mali TaxID=578113 RepID=A0A194VJU8_CYTMA|nr:hypothetical protein VM1G_11213 [Valsa mali]